MAAPNITALPTAPQRSDPANFPTRADAFVAALANYRTELNALGDYLEDLAVLADGGIYQAQSSVTDTTVGRLMLNGGHGLGSFVSADFDADATGLVTRIGRMLLPNTPNGLDNYLGFHISRATDLQSAQIAIRSVNSSNPSQMEFRQRGSDGIWSAWTRIYHESVAVAAVSQSGGIPTGGLIEKGNSANGYFMKFASGNTICWHTLAASAGGAVTWTYPSGAFTEAPVVTGSVIATVNSSFQLDAAPGTSTATFSARNAADARRADTCTLFAAGRWSSAIT